MNRTHAAAVSISLAAILIQGAGAQPADLDARTGGILVSDQTLNTVYLTRDTTGNGEADLVTVFFDENNASGLPNPTSNTFAIFQSASGWIYTADGISDAIYRLRDLKGDGSANGVGEASIWFDNSNAEGHVLTSPNGLWEDEDGAIYIMNAGTVNNPVDAIYRTIDLNGDGTANGPGESTLWMDLQTLIPNSSAFEMVFIDGVAYWADLMSGAPNTIFWAEDLNGDGKITEGEFGVFIDANNPYGCPIQFALATDGEYLYSVGRYQTGEPVVVARLKDLNGNRMIDSPDECVIVWDASAVPSGGQVVTVFSVAAGPDRSLAITSNGSSPDAKLVVLLRDLDGDGSYMGLGETTIWAYAAMYGDFITRARAVEFILPTSACPGDVTGDGTTGHADLAALLSAYGTEPGDPNWNPAADLDGDGVVGHSDLAALLADWGCGM